MRERGLFFFFPTVIITKRIMGDLNASIDTFRDECFVCVLVSHYEASGLLGFALAMSSKLTNIGRCRPEPSASLGMPRVPVNVVGLSESKMCDSALNGKWRSQPWLRELRDWISHLGLENPSRRKSVCKCYGVDQSSLTERLRRSRLDGGV